MDSHFLLVLTNPNTDIASKPGVSWSWLRQQKVPAPAAPSLLISISDPHTQLSRGSILCQVPHHDTILYTYATNLDISTWTHPVRGARQNYRQPDTDFKTDHPAIGAAVGRSDAIEGIHRQKPREKRQRIFISELYERKIDHIAEKLEDFGRALGKLEHSPQPTAIASSFHVPSATGDASNLTQPSTSSPASRSAQPIMTPKVEYEGESSLSAQAAFANSFLRDAVISKPPLDVTGEMASILESLNRTVGNQSGQQDAELLYPHARALEPGFNIRNLPMPPVESAFVCLRMAREHPRVRFSWNHEANSISSFTEYFLKVYSPGDATHSDLIIKADFAKQATVCRDNLETVLSNLPFHQPSNMDSTCAMMLAAMYCLDTCKPSAAWNFIAAASQMSQTLGMQSIVAMSQDDVETKAQKIKLFWLIYVQEKGLSLRLGRSSTIRDSDITIPPLAIDVKQDTALYGQLQKWTEFGSLQGRVYDQIYSPGALILPQNVRIARARQLASELEAHSTKTSAGEKRYLEVMRDAVGERFFEAFVSTTRVTHLSLFCLIYRAIPAEPNEGTIFGKECITSAREALRAHERCMAVVADFEQDIIETYINWALLQSPFVPFIVLFCHIIETLNESDLALLGNLVETLQSASADSFSMGVIKEIRLFKVLYDVACKYVTLKSNGQEADTDPWADAASLFMPPPIQPAASPAVGQGLSQTIFAGSGQSDIESGTTFTNTPAWQPGVFGTTGELGMEVDPQGTQFGNWLYLNNQMMRVLEDSYF
ncbi:hypothetical protein Cob_v005838 [Colletotrichum orbiculare MAFF 240422]|uniref:Xylanolytic transcriptional activator regulatory domain-containing protein n=1 Tax=Colletotrichum orbiculare (strain 104-T / ATCC 96160 / CBS 514.97 / LARS 414 / MAFF 240422) TaxID=1213857 RepID=A0A484FU04_COLOR|nr:hypothetical protein Cob_v005838 [Colletotrichum orbiculare MAFF 240422]